MDRYAPECLPDLIRPIASGEADAVFGSRMLERGQARTGGMPLYKLVGNRILTRLQNRLLRSSLSEFHSGYRLYSTAALRRIPFQLNSNAFHFDTEIIIQLLRAGQRIKELSIPTFYGDEICHVNGMKYAKDVILASLKARAQDLSLFYDRKFDCAPPSAVHSHDRLKLGFESTHELALARIPAGARVLEIGPTAASLAEPLRSRGCDVTRLVGPPDDRTLPARLDGFDCVILLDVVEHLPAPERFVDMLLAAAARNPQLLVLVSTGNLAFFVLRLMLLLGQFNYSKQGILDLTHTRLFTFGTFRRLFEQSGFDVLEMRGVPAPFPFALPDRLSGRGLLALNRALIRVSRSLFAYQIFGVVRPRPSLSYLLDQAEQQSGIPGVVADRRGPSARELPVVAFGHPKVSY